MNAFLSGMITMGCLVAGVFFLKFWRRSRDPLFVIFAMAFWLLALNHFVLVATELPGEERGWVYLLRLAAFSLLAIAIAYKNVGRRSGAR